MTTTTTTVDTTPTAAAQTPAPRVYPAEKMCYCDAYFITNGAHYPSRLCY